MSKVLRNEQHRFRWLWVVAGIAIGICGALTIGAFLAGWLFAAIALPFYCWTCSSDFNPIPMLMHQRIASEDYLHFLATGQCSQLPTTTGAYSDSYLGLKSTWGDDAMSNVFANIFAVAERWFIVGGISGAETITSALRENRAIAALYVLVYLGVLIVLGALLTHFARDLYGIIKEKVVPKRSEK